MNISRKLLSLRSLVAEFTEDAIEWPGDHVYDETAYSLRNVLRAIDDSVLIAKREERDQW